VLFGATTLVLHRAACCYIGVAFRAANTSNHVPVFYDGDWVKAANIHNFTQPNITAAAGVYTSFTMPTVPAPSTVMRVRAVVVGGASAGVHISSSSAAADDILVIGTAASFLDDAVDSKAAATLYYNALITADHVAVRCSGFNMHVPRLAR
jgi:hypothetical protein